MGKRKRDLREKTYYGNYFQGERMRRKEKKTFLRGGSRDREKKKVSLGIREVCKSLIQGEEKWQLK